MLVRQSAWPSSIPSTGRFPYEGTGVPLWPEARGVKVVSFGPREYFAMYIGYPKEALQ